MGLHKLWNRAKQWGANSWQRAKHIGAQGLNKAAALYDKFDENTGGNAANTIAQGIGKLASLSPWANGVAKMAGKGISAIGGMMSDGNKWKHRFESFGKGLSSDASNSTSNSSSNNSSPATPNVKKRPVIGNSDNNYVKYGDNSRLG